MCIEACLTQTNIGRLLLTLGISVFPLIRPLISKQNNKQGKFKPFLVHALDSDVPTQEFWKQRGTRFRAVGSNISVIGLGYV